MKIMGNLKKTILLGTLMGMTAVSVGLASTRVLTTKELSLKDVALETQGVSEIVYADNNSQNSYASANANVSAFSSNTQKITSKVAPKATSFAKVEPRTCSRGKLLGCSSA